MFEITEITASKKKTNDGRIDPCQFLKYFCIIRRLNLSNTFVDYPMWVLWQHLPLSEASPVLAFTSCLSFWRNQIFVTCTEEALAGVIEVLRVINNQNITIIFISKGG